MNIDELFQDPEYGNFVCVYVGLVFVGQILERYTKNGLQQVHQKIHTSLEGYPQCTGTCGNGSPRCETCKNWQEKLKTFRRKQNFDWTKQKSWQWTRSYEDIAGIFTSSPRGPFNFGHLSVTCSIWESCTEFNIEPSVLKNVNKCRNDYFEHNETLKVTDDNKAETFGALTDLLNEGDIQNHINKDYLNRLEEIKNGKNLPPEIIRSSVGIKKIRNEKDKVVKIVTEPNEAGTEDRKAKQQERQQLEHVYLRARLDVILNILRSIHSYSKYVCVTGGILVAIVVVYFLHSYLPGDQTLELYFTPSRSYMNSFDRKYSGCLSEFYEDHTSSQSLDFRHLWDLPTQNKLIGREWIFNLFEEKMFQPQNKSRGILMIAEYGFGKSAIVAHLLCAQENEKGWKLRQHVVAFHVCKFRNEISKKPVQLIKRLRWFLSVKSDAYRRHIASLKNSIIDDDEKCEKHIGKCFDDVISNPLAKLTIPHDAPWIVVIDALDECNDTDDRNRILELLRDRLIHIQQDGPKWFKWIITSRFMISLKHLEKLDSMNFPFKDTRNNEDIRKFIIAQVNVSNVRLLDSLVSKCNGNILYTKHVLEYIVESGNVSLQNIDNLPRAIEEIYELDFDRLFGNKIDFVVAKHILQLISVNRYYSADLLRIIEAMGITNEKEFERIMDKLSFFIKSNGYVTFRHLSLYYWLISNTSSNYKISKREGHAAVANYLFNVTDVKDLQPAVSYYGYLKASAVFYQFIYHVSESEETHLERIVFSLKLSHYNKTTSYPFPNKYTDRVGEHFGTFPIKMFKLIVNFAKNKTDQRQTFIRFIRLLYDSAVYFDRTDIVSFVHEDVIHLNKIDNFPLHTAAKHCSGEIARYLIDASDISLWESDHVGRRASDLSCRYGCADVLKVYVEKDRSLLDIKCILYATYLPPKGLVSFIEMLVANRIKPECADKTSRKQMAIRLYPKHLFYPYETFEMIVHSSVFMLNDEKREANVVHLFLFFKYSLLHIVSENKVYLTLSGFLFRLEDGHEDVTLIVKNVNMFIDLNPDQLSCPDVQGSTLTLKYIVRNEYGLFSGILGKGIMNDECQRVSNGMLYLYNVLEKYMYKRYGRVFLGPFLYFSCPEGASVEHLLLRHKRLRMINSVLANGYTMNWTKTDRKGKTPLDYADQMFILQLECHFGVDIHVLSDKDSLVKLCSCEWFYVYLLLFIFALDVSIALFCIVLYCTEIILC